jgi:O-antigen/teichoic acid export membrane protein
MGNFRSVVVNIGWLGASQLADYLLRAVIAVVVARHLGVEQYGLFAPAVALVLMAVVFTDLGLRMTVLKAGSSAPESLLSVATIAFSLKGALIVVVYGILLSAAAAMGFAGREFLLTAILGAGVFLGSFTDLFTAILQAKERMGKVGTAVVGYRIALLAVVTATVLVGGGVMEIAVAYALAGLFGTLVSGVLALPYLRGGRLTALRVRPLMRETLQFGIAGTLVVLFLQADIVMLRVLHPSGQYESGLYGAVFRLVSLLYAVPIVVQSAVIPRLYKYAGDPELLMRAYRVLFRWSTAISVSLSAVSLALAPTLVELFFGFEYAPAWPAFAVLAAGLWPHHLNYACGDVLYAAGRQGWRASALAVTVALNILMNFVLIPAYGSVGAAVSTLVSEIVLFSLLFASLQRRYPQPVGGVLTVPLILGIGVALILWFARTALPTFGQLALGALAALALPLCLLWSGYLRIEDVVTLGGKEQTA